uniref:GlutR_dimer domain-containing protein n=1 Tax=Meloidogyne hapla TaxID=6305 RepID=A0A1I8BLE7_MELHA
MSAMSFEQHKILINSSPERHLLRKHVEERFKLLREDISKLDVKVVERVSRCKQVAPDPRGSPKEEEEDVHLLLPDFAIKCSCKLLAPDPRGPPYKEFEVVNLLLPAFAKPIRF